MYQTLSFMFSVIFKLVFRWKIIGEENIPRDGGVIIAANHLSNWDPPVVGTASSRMVHFMAKEELFAIPVLGWIIRQLESFPVKRGASDRNAIRNAISLLENGQVLGLFPEGKRSKDGKLGKVEPGMALIAAKTGAVIVPAAIKGTNKVFSSGCLFPQFSIEFGKPIYTMKGNTDKATLENITQTIVADINRLLNN